MPRAAGEHALRETRKGELDVAKVYRLWEIQFLPGVKAEDYEKLILEEWRPLAGGEGWHFLHLLKGDRGHGEGQYLVMYVAESVEIRDRTDSGRRSGEDQQAREAKAELWEKARAMTNFIYTDYVALGE